MAKNIVEIILGLALVGLCVYLNGCIPPPGNGYGSQPANITRGQAYNAAEDQWLADWQMRGRIQALEQYQLHERLNADDDGDE